MGPIEPESCPDLPDRASQILSHKLTPDDKGGAFGHQHFEHTPRLVYGVVCSLPA